MTKLLLRHFWEAFLGGFFGRLFWEAFLYIWGGDFVYFERKKGGNFAFLKGDFNMTSKNE
jgi:hypothetical protein